MCHSWHNTYTVLFYVKSWRPSSSLALSHWGSPLSLLLSNFLLFFASLTPFLPSFSPSCHNIRNKGDAVPPWAETKHTFLYLQPCEVVRASLEASTHILIIKPCGPLQSPLAFPRIPPFLTFWNCIVLSSHLATAAFTRTGSRSCSLAFAKYWNIHAKFLWLGE